MPDVGGIAGAQLKSFIERIERLEDEKRARSAKISRKSTPKPKAAASSRKSCAKSSRSEEWTVARNQA